MTRKIGLYVFEGFQLLDMSGPATAFEVASQVIPGSYELSVISHQQGIISSSGGVGTVANSCHPLDYDTLMIVGGPGISTMVENVPLQQYIRKAAAKVRRLASVCSGAFLLASSGILNGHRATTHWSRAEQLARDYPKVRVEFDSIYVCDGKIWTSAGITAGIDLALALIAEDLGRSVATQVARQLVVYYRRPGRYSQKSVLLEIAPSAGLFSELMGWVREHLDEVLVVECLADRMAMSPRNFSRAFRRETGITPAKAVEQLRLEVASARIEQGHDNFDNIAASVGFISAERMRKAFLRTSGESPQTLRHRAQND